MFIAAILFISAAMENDNTYPFISMNGEYEVFRVGDDLFRYSDRHTGFRLNDCSGTRSEPIFCFRDETGFEISLPRDGDFYAGREWQTEANINRVIFFWTALGGENYFKVISSSLDGYERAFLYSTSCGLVSFRDVDGTVFSSSGCGFLQPAISGFKE